MFQRGTGWATVAGMGREWLRPEDRIGFVKSGSQALLMEVTVPKTRAGAAPDFLEKHREGPEHGNKWGKAKKRGELGHVGSHGPWQDV